MLLQELEDVLDLADLNILNLGWLYRCQGSDFFDRTRRRAG